MFSPSVCISRFLNFFHFPCRRVVIELFLGKGPNAKLKKGEIIEAAKIRLQKEPTNSEFQKVSVCTILVFLKAWLVYFNFSNVSFEYHICISYCTNMFEVREIVFTRAWARI